MEILELGQSTMNVGFPSTQCDWLPKATEDYRFKKDLIYMTSGDSLGFTQTTWDFNPEKWMSSLVNLVNIHFPMTPTCGLPGLSPLKLGSWIMGFTFFPAAGGWGCWSPVLCFPLVSGDVWILRAFFSSGDVDNRHLRNPEIHQKSW